jgi:hypothetical protein
MWKWLMLSLLARLELQYQMALSKRLNSNCIKAFVVANFG